MQILMARFRAVQLLNQRITVIGKARRYAVGDNLIQAAIGVIAERPTLRARDRCHPVLGVISESRCTIGRQIAIRVIGIRRAGNARILVQAIHLIRAGQVVITGVEIVGVVDRIIGELAGRIIGSVSSSNGLVELRNI